MSAVDKLFQGNVKLPSPPAIAVKILETVRQDDYSVDKLAQIITSDPALTAKVLGVANSSYYALPNKVNTIERAISLVGVDALKNLALSFVIAKEMKGTSIGLFDYNFFWKRAVTAAVASELLAPILDYKNDDAFVSALLKDVGVVIMYLCSPNDYLSVLREKQAKGLSSIEVEQKVFGFDHQDVGSEILKRWDLPQSIYAPIALHHRGEVGEGQYAKKVELLILSDCFSKMYHSGRIGESVRELEEVLQAGYGMETGAAEELIDAVANKSIEILSTFEIDAGDMKPYSQILQEANEELGKLNISYEQLVLEYKQAKEEAEALTEELKEANQKLQELVFKDGLTGLYNHRYFQELMDKELDRSRRYAKEFSLILFDIDHFKKINDSYGHPGGDQVLKSLSNVVLKTMRESDMVARYGGEEFAVVLPETNETGAKVFAERLRRAIEQLETLFDNRTIKCTISLGVTTCLPGAEVENKSILIDSADKALYRSKNNGRNQVSVESLPAG